MPSSTSLIKEYFQQLNDSNLVETARREKFVSLLSMLFPANRREIASFTGGAEHGVHYLEKGIIKSGNIDTFYGNLIIEFERKLPLKISEAERQLKEYCAGIWNQENRQTNHVCIASDGITWNVYATSSNQDKSFDPSEISLLKKESLSIVNSQKSWDDFFVFLNRIFFREGSIKPTIENIERDFGLLSPFYEKIESSLTTAFSDVRETADIKTAWNEWKRYLTYVYGEFNVTEKLFLRHTYLTVFSKFIAWAALSGKRPDGQSMDGVIEDILSGSFFERIGISNFSEKDFFHWVRKEGPRKQLEGLWIRLIDLLMLYDFSNAHGDLLKGLYQELVDPKDRHFLGEYYTPEWLSKRIIRKLTKGKKGIPSTIDISCGSGSFLVAAINHQISTYVKNDSTVDHKQKVLDDILNKIAGIDVHPLAVTISKTNYLLSIRTLLQHRNQQVTLPVFLADSLHVPEITDADLWGEKRFRIPFDGKHYDFPIKILEHHQTFDDLIVLASEVAHSLALDNKAETVESIQNGAAKKIYGLSKADAQHIAKDLFEFSNHLASKIRKNENTIWSYVLRNRFRPSLLFEKFDLVVGNPPWLSYRYISDPQYQKQAKYLAVEKYRVAPRQQKLFTQMELATTFLLHAVEHFLNKEGKLGFVMPRSIFNGDQHSRFRQESFTAPCDITEYWDLDKVRPLFNVPSCVVFAKKGAPKTTLAYPLTSFQGVLPRKEATDSEANDAISIREGLLHLVKMGSRDALSESKITVSQGESYYKSRFHQGATVVPRNFYFVNKTPIETAPDSEVFFLETDREQDKEAKPPYKGTFVNGRIERSLVFRTVLAKQVVPFGLLDPSYVVLPLTLENGAWHLNDASELNGKGLRDGAKWFKDVSRFWTEKREAKADSHNYLEWLDYNGKLTRQDPSLPYKVLYASSGKNACAAMLSSDSYDFPFFADAKTYWFAPESREEGLYLVSVLNSETLNELIKPFQSKGLLGERDIHTKILEAPIPRFDSSQDSHMRLAGLGEKANLEVRKLLNGQPLGATTGRGRTIVRGKIKPILEEIDCLVSALF